MCVSSADPASVVRRQEALEAARRRMQEEQDARAAEFREKQQRVSLEWRPDEAGVWFAVFMLVYLFSLAGGGKEKTENRDVGKYEGRKELQRKC